MRWCFNLVLVILCFFPAAKTFGAQTAQARMYCLSLHFQEATDTTGIYSLDMTTIASGLNGELPPDWLGVGRQTPTGYSNSTWILLSDLSGNTYAGVLYLNLPPATDTDGNG